MTSESDHTQPSAATVWAKAFGLGALGALALGIGPIVVAGAQGADAGDPNPRAGAGDPNGSSHAPPSDEPSLAATEFAFDPVDLAIPAAQEVTVELVNDGATVHNWTVLSEEITAESEFEDSLVLGGVPDVNGGEASTSALTLEPGEYQVICTITGHFDAGMEGTVAAE